MEFSEIISLVKLIPFLINKLRKKPVRIHVHPGMTMTPVGISFALRFCVSNISDLKIYASELDLLYFDKYDLKNKLSTFRIEKDPFEINPHRQYEKTISFARYRESPYKEFVLVLVLERGEAFYTKKSYRDSSNEKRMIIKKLSKEFKKQFKNIKKQSDLKFLAI